MNNTNIIDMVNGKTENINSLYHNSVPENYIRLILNELRNSLNSIIGGVSLINIDSGTKDDYSLKLIDFGASSILSIIDIITDIAQSKNNKSLINTDLVIDLESFIQNIEMDINTFSDITEKPTFVINYFVLNTHQIILDKDILQKIINLLLLNIVHSTDINKVDINFSSAGSKYIISLEGTTNFIPVNKTPYIYNIFNKPHTISNKKYLQEPRLLFQVFINELLKIANAEIEVITSGKQGVTFNIIMPNSS